MDIGKRIKLRRNELNMTLKELGLKANVSDATIQRYESGIITNIPSDRIEAISVALNVSPSYLMGWENIDIEKIQGIIPLKRTRKIPILGTVACGTPVFAEENYEGYFIADEIIKADFCLHCRGDSMIDANINDGDLVFVKKTNTVENGTIAVVMIDDCATLKRVTKIDDNYILQPANKNYEPIILSEDHENLIIGEMVGVYSARNK